MPLCSWLWVTRRNCSSSAMWFVSVGWFGSASGFSDRSIIAIPGSCSGWCLGIPTPLKWCAPKWCLSSVCNSTMWQKTVLKTNGRRPGISGRRRKLHLLDLGTRIGLANLHLDSQRYYGESILCKFTESTNKVARCAKIGTVMEAPPWVKNGFYHDMILSGWFTC